MAKAKIRQLFERIRRKAKETSADFIATTRPYHSRNYQKFLTRQPTEVLEQQFLNGDPNTYYLGKELMRRNKAGALALFKKTFLEQDLNELPIRARSFVSILIGENYPEELPFLKEVALDKNKSVQLIAKDLNMETF